MVKDSNRTGLFVAIPLYLGFVICCGLWVYVKNRKASKSGQHADSLTQHYLGGRDFGSFVTVMTFFASLFSGYTVVGVPNEANRLGFVALWWIGICEAIVFGSLLFVPRLRRLSLARNYQSPCDFISDRFNSNLLRYTMFAIMLVPSWMYLAGQVNSLASVFNVMLFGLDKMNFWGILAISLIILGYEWLGGLESVALTDAVQGVIMLIGFFTLLIVTCTHFGGTVTVGEQASTCDDTAGEVTCDKLRGFYSVPSANTQFNTIFEFSMSGLSFVVLPHFIQRVFAAGNYRSIKQERGGHVMMRVPGVVATG
jgi:Na+/proline symporter